MALTPANILLRITGVNDDAKRALREVAAEAKAFEEKEYAAHIGLHGTAEAEAKLNELEASLTLLGQRNVTASVNVDVDTARAKLALLKKELAFAGRGGAGARPMQAILQDIAAVGVEIGKLAGEGVSDLGAFGKAAGEVGSDFSTLAATGGKAIGSIIASSLQFLVQWVVIGAVVGPIVLALAGVVATLAAGLAAALAGAVALGVALAALAVPVAIVGIGAALTGGKIIGAALEKSKAQDPTAVKERARAREDAQFAVQDASQQVVDANDAVTQSAKTLKDETTNAYRAWHQGRPLQEVHRR
jgi:hypothetical protein